MKSLAFFSAILFVLSFLLCASALAADRPNFLIVLCDDLGYGDLACFGDPVVQTPHLDRFAKEGLRLTHCYSAAPNCSPARTGLMTGRTPYRAGIHNWIPESSPMHLKREEITIATLLRNAGYDTCHSGKWHLNGGFNLPSQPQPGDHGFNHWFSAQNNALPNHRNPDNFVRNGKPVGKLEGYSSHLVAAEAIDWLANIRDKTKPFFIYCCFHEPHEPIATDPKYAALYADTAEGNESYMAYYGNITQMDAAFGSLMAALDAQQLRDSTLVFFSSDNGPAITNRHPHGSAGPLRANKGHLYEGGIRVPGILRWPGHTRPGTESATPVCGVDVLPTFCEIAGLPVPGDRPLDGASFLPVLAGKLIERRTPLYWQFTRAASHPKVALREGPWKIVAGLDAPMLPPGADLTAQENEALKTAPLTGFELYNLEDDVAEANDLAKAQPERLAALKKKLIAKHREVRAESPVWPAWTWPKSDSARIQWPPYKGVPK